MAKSAFEEYPRQTAVRLILLMGGTGLLLLVAGLLGKITTFWAAGTVLILFAVASWPEKAKAERLATEEPSPGEEEPTHRTRCTAKGITSADDPALESLRTQLESVRVQFELLQEEVTRRERENIDPT